jgi:hypothetical protein
MVNEAETTNYIRGGGTGLMRDGAIHTIRLTDRIKPVLDYYQAANNEKGSVTGPVFDSDPDKLCAAYCPVAQGMIEGIRCSNLHPAIWVSSAVPGATPPSRTFDATVYAPYAHPDSEPDPFGDGDIERFDTVFDSLAHVGKIPCQTGVAIFQAAIAEQQNTA